MSKNSSHAFVPWAVYNLPHRGAKQPPAGRCFYCGEDTIDIEHDHMPTPWSAGGKHACAACAECHRLKDKVAPKHWPTPMLKHAQDDFDAAGLGFIVQSLLRRGDSVVYEPDEFLTDLSRLTSPLARTLFARFYAEAVHCKRVVTFEEIAA